MSQQAQGEPSPLERLTRESVRQQNEALSGGTPPQIQRQLDRGRLTARQRIEQLVDPESEQLEIGRLAGRLSDDSRPSATAAGVVTTIARVAGRRQMILADDATLRRGALVPATVKKILRAQYLALTCRLPVIYLVDSLGALLPFDVDIFPERDDLARVYRNSAELAAAGVPQVAAILGDCLAVRGCLPWRADKLLVTEGARFYSVGGSHQSEVRVSAAAEALGDAVDYCERDEAACLARLRSVVEQFEPQQDVTAERFAPRDRRPSAREGSDIYRIVDPQPNSDYEVRDLLDCIVDGDSFDEYKAAYGGSIVCGTARISGRAVGIVANQHHRITTADGRYHFGGVMYVESAEKAARFVLNCNQDWLPIVFLQNVNGFMIGRDSERNGIIKAGAKLVNAVSNSRVPKITILIGGSFGAGNYALCGKAFDPRLIFAWPNARCAVMGSDQATSTLMEITVKSLQRRGRQVDEAELAALDEKLKNDYQRQTDIHYAAARGWVDAIIDPARTRDVLDSALQIATRHVADAPLCLGVFQV